MLGLGSDDEDEGGVERDGSRREEEVEERGDWVLVMRRKVTKMRRVKRERMKGYFRSFNRSGIAIVDHQGRERDDWGL